MPSKRVIAMGVAAVLASDLAPRLGLPADGALGTGVRLAAGVAGVMLAARFVK